MLKQILITVGLMAATALAQTSTPPATKDASKAKTRIAAKPASQSVNSAAATHPAPAVKAKRSRHAARKPVTKPAPAIRAVSPAPVAQKPSAMRAGILRPSGRRDPFVSPIRLQEDRMKGTSLCTTGARCLVIDQVELKGIVKTPEGMIAMVENSAKRQYNLREKDQVFNGTVLKIDGDSVTFRETVTDNLGHQTTKEVVKKVTVPVI